MWNAAGTYFLPLIRRMSWKAEGGRPQNAGIETSLRAGQRVLIPRSLLNETMARPTPERRVVPVRIVELEPVAEAISAPERLVELEPELAELHDGLHYGSDSRGDYALYTLKKGESLYSSVVARYTDFQNNEDILEACRLIARRSGIGDMRDIDAGKKIYIPPDYLSRRYLPKGNPDRERYEATLLEAARLRGRQGISKDLSDVVVILDPGHGGADTGAKHLPSGLYEDELNYDIVCRIRALLQKETGATVSVPMNDRSSGYAISNASPLSHDTAESFLTTPPHSHRHRPRRSRRTQTAILAGERRAERRHRLTESRHQSEGNRLDEVRHHEGSQLGLCHLECLALFA